MINKIKFLWNRSVLEETLYIIHGLGDEGVVYLPGVQMEMSLINRVFLHTCIAGGGGSWTYQLCYGTDSRRYISWNNVVMFFGLESKSWLVVAPAWVEDRRGSKAPK